MLKISLLFKKLTNLKMALENRVKYVKLTLKTSERGQ